MKPIIGITANFIKDGQFGVNAHIGGAGQFWQALADDYIRSVVLAGGVPVIIPIVSKEEAASYLDALDGLLISGGCDASPLTFGADTTAAVGEICSERDELELELLQKALDTPGFPGSGHLPGLPDAERGPGRNTGLGHRRREKRRPLPGPAAHAGVYPPDREDARLPY